MILYYFIADCTFLAKIHGLTKKLSSSSSVSAILKTDIEVFSITLLCLVGNYCFIAFIMTANDFVLFQCYIACVFSIKHIFLRNFFPQRGLGWIFTTLFSRLKLTKKYKFGLYHNFALVHRFHSWTNCNGLVSKER